MRRAVRPFVSVTGAYVRTSYAFRYYTSARETIDTAVKGNPCVVFMKGTPDYPMCGFSRAVVQALQAERAKITSFNVLENEDIRSEIKSYSDWPTLPQVYIGGEFIGGCDIILDHYKKGELGELLEKAGGIEEGSD
eukprot:TRINITY_DN369_c0_g1_i1.p1 TRINITY_DN369_c0_g1~~TRINITY_DN369_c0_g1_i1.p1  ORF type:complete len:136 (-),score=24.04 TRINITY_DN369_c0_g1_i1:60-467(-)